MKRLVLLFSIALFCANGQFSSNATKLRGKRLCSGAAPADGQTLVFSSASNCWGPSSSSSAGSIGSLLYSLPASAAGSLVPEVHKNLAISNGATSTILSQVTGSGYIGELFIATNKYATEVIVTVDGEGTPQIDANVCDLLADHYCDTQPAAFNYWISVSNFGAQNSGGTLRLPIFFSSSVKVEAKCNAGSTCTITSHIIARTGVSTDLTQWRLHLVNASVSGIAANTETNMINVSPAKPWLLAFLGWIYDGFPGNTSPRDAPLEGAFKMYFDGSGTAGYAVGGSEDLFGMPWYFQNAPIFGNTIPSTMSPASVDVSLIVKNSNTWGAQRSFVRDQISGSSGLRFTWFCGNTSAVNFTGTCSLFSNVYYYTLG